MADPAPVPNAAKTNGPAAKPVVVGVKPTTPPPNTTIVQGKAPEKAPAPPLPPAFILSSLQTRHKWIKLLVYGAHGAGKTELCGSSVDVPAMCDVFMLSAEKGEMTIEETPRIKNKGGLFTVQVDNVSQVSKVRDWLVAHCMYRDANNEEGLKKLERAVGYDIEGPAKRFHTVIVDSITEIQAFTMYNILGMKAEHSLDAQIPDQEWPHYNQILNRTQLMMRSFRDLPMHVLMICQRQYTQDETKKMHYAPQLLGQSSEKVQGFVDIVGFLQKIPAADSTTDDTHRLWVQPVGKFAAKNRKASFEEDYFDNPTMLQICKGLGLTTQKA